MIIIQNFQFSTFLKKHNIIEKQKRKVSRYLEKFKTGNNQIFNCISVNYIFNEIYRLNID